MTVTGERAADGGLDRVTVLLVDDDERWARATGRLLESSHDAFDVEAANSLDAGRDRFASLDPDCVVCDYQLGDGTGLDLLETVRERDPDRPFLLVTGRGSEAIASDAIRRGVTDYIRKGDEDPALLAGRVANAVRTYRTERALERERRSKNAVLDILTATTDSAGLSRQFTSQLVDERGYACAWIGAEEDAGRLRPRAAAGRDAYLDDVLDPDSGLSPAEPAAATLDCDEGVVVAPLEVEEGATENWQTVAWRHGFEAAVAAPIRHDGVRFGVLAAYADDAGMIDDREVASITEYAETLGYALRTAEWKRSLVASDPVSLEVELTDETVPLVALTDRLPGATVTVPSAVTRDDGSTLYVASVEPASADEVRAAVAAVDGVTAIDVRTRDGVACDLAVDAPTPERVVADAGARFERTVAEAGVATLAVEVPDDGAVETVTDALGATFGDATVSTIWTDRRSTSADAGDPLADLTDRQREILQHAFHVGYFERPRGASATELADQLDIARATLTQHLRAAQRKVFGEVLA